MTERIMRMETLSKDYEYVRTGVYKNKKNEKLYQLTFDNGLAYAEEMK